MKRLPYLLLCFASGACTEEMKSPLPGDDAGIVLTTDVGFPVDNPVTKTIGAVGGSITSADGVIEINIPAGALSSDTDISIQPVSKELPNATGSAYAYDLLPDGTTFNKPVTLTFHYTDENVNGSDPRLLAIVYQDDENSWVSDLAKQKLNTATKTVSLDVNHFTIFTSVSMGITIWGKSTLQQGEKGTYYLVEELGERPDHKMSYGPVPPNLISQWSVDPSLGTLTGSGTSVTFTAPATVSTPTKVKLSALINIKLVYYENGQRIEVNGFRPGKFITILPPLKYKINVLVVDSTISTFFPGLKTGLPIYTDNAEFEMTFDPTTLQATIIGDIANHPPTVVPPSQEFHLTSFIWTPDPYGVIDVENIAVLDQMPADSVITFVIEHRHASYPGYLTKSAETGEAYVTMPPRPFFGKGGLPMSFQIDLKKKVSHYDVSQQNFPGSGKWTNVFVDVK